MKNITATLLTLAILASLTACGGNNDTPADTTATAETTTTAAVTEETTTAPVDIDSMLEGYTLHKMVSDELESFRETFPDDSALGKIAVEVTDYDGLYLLIEDEGITENNDGGYERAKVRRVICGDVVQDCDITFVFGPDGFSIMKTEEYTIVSRYGYYSYHYVFQENGCTHIPMDYGRDGGSLYLYIHNGVLKYRITNPKYIKVLSDFEMLSILQYEDEWYREVGELTISCEGEIELKSVETKLIRDEQDLDDLFSKIKNGYYTDTDGYDFTQFETLDELLEYNKLKAEKGEAEAFLTTIPVYEYSYEDCKHFDEFDRIGKDEYAKYAAGEDFDEYYAIRFAEYPDIAIVGQVVTEPGKNQSYDQRVMDSVIRNGERHYLTENKSGPGFSVHITDDFVCVVMAASGIGAAFYAYDGGSENHCRNTLSNNGQTVEPWDINGDFSIHDLYETDGVMNYYLYGKNYEGEYMSGFRGIARVYEGPDDDFWEQGTIQLIDGKIQYVASKTLTVAEWYKTQTGFQEESGCYTIEEFIEWLKAGAR